MRAGFIEQRELDLLMDLAGKGRTLFGRYEVIEEIGRGGMGVVYKCKDRTLDRFVALKGLSDAFGGETERFLREAQTAGRLRHPNIVPVYDVGRDGDELYLTMELVDGRSLGARIADASLDRRGALEVLRQVAGALDYAHRQGVIHRDVKPDNILIDAGGRALLTDFGLAKRVAADARLTMTGVIVGTPAYMSPEQAAGKPVGTASDVYSLGATLYFVLTGRPPYDGASPLEVALRVAGEDPPRPRDLNPNIARDIETLCLKAMERDPRRRYASAAELGEDLRRTLAGEPILAQPPSLAYRVRRSVRRNRAMAAVVFVVLAAAAALAIQAAVQESREDALTELSSLWNRVVLAKQGIRMPQRDPNAIRADLERAVEAISDYVRRHPDHPQGYYVRARARLYLGDDAEPDAREAIRLAPDFGPGWALLARILLDRYLSEFYSAPGTVVNRRLKPLLIEARDALARGNLDLQRWGLVRTREDDEAEILLEALALRFLRDDADAAIERLQRADAAEPSEELRNVLALLHAGDDAAQIDWNSRAIEVAPHYAKAHLDRGTARFNAGDAVGAVADLTRAVELGLRTRVAHLNRGAALAGLHRYREALGDLDRAVELKPDDAVALTNRGVVRRELGDLDGALADANRSVDLDPQMTAAYVNRASTHMARGEWRLAEEDCARALALDERDAMAHYTLGKLAADPAAAREHYTRAIEADPKYALSYVNRGILRARQGDLDGAIADYTEAIRVDPNCAPAYYNRGVDLQQKGDAGGALSDYSRAIELDPSNADARLNRAALWLDRGDRAAAIEDYRRALEAAPPDWPHRRKVEEFLSREDDF